MKNLITLFLSFGLVSTFAQVVNDDCGGTINLGTAPICDGTVYSNLMATPSDIGQNNQPECFSEEPARDVWFSFIADSEVTDYVITIEGSDNGGRPIENIQAGIYRGFCPDNVFAINNCATSQMGQSTLEFAVTNLTPNDLYFIRIDNFGGANASGDFTVCIKGETPEFTIADEGSSECEGILYDTGGANSSYSANEEHTFTICPGVLNQCVEFNLEYFNIESDNDQLIFYDGETADEDNIILTVGGFQFQGDGGVCKTVYATNCMTIKMITDDDLQFEGFKGSWQCSNLACDLPESIAIDTNALMEEIANKLSSSLVDITVTNIACENESFGTFTAGNDTDLGISDGIILTTGNAAAATGPNVFEDTGLGFGSPGDEDLDILSELFGDNLASNDACVIEVDAFVNTSELNFQFLFGSEEYPEFAPGNFNDIFALFIKGPGIEGIPELDGKKNLAILPGTETPIQINSVNSQFNWEYFRNNQQGLSTEYDGLVVDVQGNQKSLTATADVIPCNVYSLKFAIADRVDFIYDSGVFISELTNDVPEISLVTTHGFDYVLERCTDGQEQIIIQLSEPQDEEIKFATRVTGSATINEDFELSLSDTIVIAPGQTIVNFPITILSDDIEEGTESIQIILENDFGCGIMEISNLEIEIRESIELVAMDGLDEVYVCSGNNFMLFAEGATTYNWSPSDGLDNANIENPTIISPEEPVTYTVTGTIEPFTNPECSDSDMVTILPIEAELELILEGPDTICLGDSVGVRVITNTDLQGFSWQNPELGITNPDSNFTFIKPSIVSSEPIAYIASIVLEDCTVSDTVFLQVQATILPEIIVQDSIVCEGYQVQLTEEVENDEGVSYQWTPSDHLSNDTIPNPIATAVEDITYTLVATNESGDKIDSLEVSFMVQRNSIEITASDSVFLCFPDSIMLNTISTSQGENITWEPSDILEPAIGPEVLVKPLVSGYVVATMDFDGCVDRDSVWVQTDSLPSMEFEVIQQKEMYCIGEVISIASAGYDPLDFPNIQFQWDPAPGIVSELDERNLAIIAADTATFRRITANGVCRDTIETEIFVLDPVVAIIVSDTSALCPFDPVQLRIESEHELEDIMWMPGEPELSCEDCIDPIASVGETKQVTAMMDADGCPATATAEIKIIDVQLNIIFTDNDVCPGTPVQLGLQANGPITNISWSPSNLLSCNDCPNPIITSDESVTIEVTADVDECNASATGSFRIDDGTRTAIVTVAPNDSVPAGDEIILTVQNESVFGPNTTYEWFVDGEPANATGNTFTTTQEDTVFTIYQVRIVDENGCNWQGETQAIGLFPKFELPNAFTPGNPDQVNDVFRLIQTPAVALDNWEVTRFEIYNRWGQRIFECETRECALQTGWNGRLENNSLAPADVYIYAIQVEIDNGDTIDFRGDVTLLR